jgi:hypothetical protein
MSKIKLRVSRIESPLISQSLWHSRKLASPIIYRSPTDREKALKPPAYHRLVQIAPDGRKTLFLAAHAKRIVGRSFEDSQELIWRLINHCTQDKVRLPDISAYHHVKLTLDAVCLQYGVAFRRRHGLVGQQVCLSGFMLYENTNSRIQTVDASFESLPRKHVSKRCQTVNHHRRWSICVRC